MPLIIISITWWFFWLVISSLSLTGVKTPSLEANLIVFLFLSSLLIGGLMGIQKKSNYTNTSYINKLYKLEILYKICFNVSILIVSFLFIKSIFVIMSHGLAGYRLNVSDTTGDELLLFGNSSLELLYSIVISPFLFLIMHLGIILYLLLSKKYYLWSSFLIGFMSAAMTLGRFYFYYFMVILLVAYLLSNFKVKRKINLYKIIVLPFIIIIMISFLRSSNDNSLSHIIKQYVIEYHTIGFSLFDSELQRTNSILNNNLLFGTATLAGVERYIVLAIRRFDKSIDSQLIESNLRRNEFINIGSDGNLKNYNAYYTILYNLYMDGRHIGIVLGGLILGFLMSYNYYNWKYKSRIDSLFYTQVLFFILIFSIFTTPIEKLNLTGALVLFYLVYNVKFKRGKYEK